jgi:hypothetical protein
MACKPGLHTFHLSGAAPQMGTVTTLNPQTLHARWSVTASFTMSRTGSSRLSRHSSHHFYFRITHDAFPAVFKNYGLCAGYAHVG